MSPSNERARSHRKSLLASSYGYFLNHFNVFCPSGKSLLISGNRVKPDNKKYFAFSE